MNNTNQSKTAALAKPFMSNPIKDVLDIPNKSRDYTYRWININKFKSSGNLDHRGFEIDHDTSMKGRVFSEDGEDSKTGQKKYRDSRVVRGDLVLAKMHNNQADKIREYNEYKKNKNLEGIGNPTLKSSSLSFAAPTVEAIGNVGNENINVKEGE